MNAENGIDPGLINYADYLLREWGRWASPDQRAKGYSQVLGIRRSASYSITDDEAAAIDAAVSRLEDDDKSVIRRVYLSGGKIRNSAGWRNALRAFADRFGVAQ